MSVKPDTTKIEAALERAARKATHGTREERSGRFLLRQENRPSQGPEHAEARAAQERRRDG